MEKYKGKGQGRKSRNRKSAAARSKNTGSKSQNSGGRAKWFVIMVLSGMLLIYSFVYIEKVVEPVMQSTAAVKVQGMLVEAVNSAVRDKFTENREAGSLLEINMDDSGKVTMVQADTTAMNILAAELQADILENMGGLHGQKLKVPVGSLLESSILSQADIYVNLKVLPLAISKIEFKTEFESTGINQSCYRVFLEVESEAKIEAPFSKEKVKVSTTLPIAETIIVGDVPETYIFIPEDKVPDIIGQ